MKRIFLLFSLLFLSLPLLAIEPNLIHSESFSEIENLDLQHSFENITFENIYGEEILVEFYSNNKKKVPFILREGKTLKLKSSENIHLYPSDYCNIKFYIPYKAIFQEIKIKTVSGKIKAELLNSSSDINIFSISGQIDIENIKSESISTYSDSGSIYISSLTCDFFDSKTNNGFIEISLETSLKAASSIKTDSGNIVIQMKEKSGFDFIVSSTSGIFRDEINNLRLSPRNEYRNSYFGGGPEINIRTTSGGIILK